MFVDLNTIRILWPEFMLVLMATWIYIGGTLRQSRAWWSIFSIIVYAIVGGVVVWKEGLYWSGSDSQWGVVGPVIVDYLGYSLRWRVCTHGSMRARTMPPDQDARWISLNSKIAC